MLFGDIFRYTRSEFVIWNLQETVLRILSFIISNDHFNTLQMEALFNY